MHRGGAAYLRARVRSLSPAAGESVNTPGHRGIEPPVRVVFDARSVGAHDSGIGRYCRNLLCHLVPLADDVRYLVLRRPGSGPAIVDHPRVEERAFVGATKSVPTVFGLGLLERGFSDSDLYHAPADLVPLGLRCPWVVTIHDLMWVEAPALASAFWPTRLVNGLWYRLNIGRAVAGARRVIAISRASADAIARVYPAHAHKTHAIHHGIERERFDPSHAGPRSALDGIVPRGGRFALMVGQGSPYKNHAAMLRAFVEATAGDPRHLLVLVRRFTRVDREMAALLRRRDIRAKVIAVPHVDEATLLGLYRHASMLLFASRYEGFGFPALEAMAMGTPVLASTTPALVEVTGDAALHADPCDHADLVRSIALLDRDPDRRAELIRAGHARVAAFQWSRCAEATLAVYREAASA